MQFKDTKTDSTSQKSNTLKSLLKSEISRSMIILISFALITSGITYVLYRYTQDLLKQRLQERLVAIASTAATQFDPKDIEAIHTENDLTKPQLKKLVTQLIKIKDANKNIRYAYIMRRTENPEILSFVADAEMLMTPEELDINGNGELEDEEVAPSPGEPFEIKEYPVLHDEAFFHAAADRELHKDQWSVQMSAYAPINNNLGDAIAIIGIDVVVSDFLLLTQATLLPFILFIFFLVLLLTLLTLLLARFWNERAKFFRELDRQKDELISMVSHQLAAPVTAIKWYIEMLLDGEMGTITADQKDQLSTMQKVGADLNDLVSMILDVSRIQLGRMKLDPQPLDLNEFFKEILDVIEPKAKEKDVHLTKHIQEKLPPAKLDKRMTRMTVENLLTNAVKYTPKSGQVSMIVKVKPGNILYCEVKDTGCGIPKAEHDKIFGKLFRASNVRNNVDGNGFGLYIAKGAVEGQGGKIWFDSEENKGTTFYVELPIQRKTSS